MRLKRQDLTAVKVCYSNSLACVPTWLGLNVSDLQKKMKRGVVHSIGALLTWLTNIQTVK